MRNLLAGTSHSIFRSAGWIWHLVLPGALFLAILAGEGRAQSADKSLTPEQLEQLVAPIALYPDPLLAQVFMASTYPLEIVQAERWTAGNAKLKGRALEEALQNQTWDPSVKSIVAVPQVLKMMNDKLDWTEQLGDAFLAQQDDVVNAIQALRQRAQTKGTLKTTSQQKVSTQTTGATTAVVIEPADPQVIYVPAYDPGVVYGDWPYPSYPPYSWYPPGYVASNVISFGLGVAAGAAIWGGWNWANRQININPLRYNSFNRTNISNTNWQHNVAHRKGVPYNNANVAQRFGQKSGTGASREAFRGRAEQLGSGGGQIGQNRPGGQASGQGARTPGQGAGTKGAKSTVAGKAQNRPTRAADAGGVKALDGLGRGQGVRQESARGAASRNAMASARPAGGGPAVAARGGGGGARGGGGGGRVGGGGRRSDIRLKHDVILLGRLDNGLGFYRFSYNGSDKSYVGVIAQEVQAVVPQAVVRGRDGYLRVFYDKLGLTFQTYDHWMASGTRVPAADQTLH